MCHVPRASYSTQPAGRYIHVTHVYGNVHVSMIWVWYYHQIYGLGPGSLPCTCAQFSRTTFGACMGGEPGIEATKSVSWWFPVQIARWATEAFFKHGGEPHFVFPTTLGPSNQMTGSPAMLATPPNPSGMPQTPQQQQVKKYTITNLRSNESIFTFFPGSPCPLCTLSLSLPRQLTIWTCLWRSESSCFREGCVWSRGAVVRETHWTLPLSLKIVEVRVGYDSVAIITNCTQTFL